MKISYTFKHTDADESLKQYALEKSEKLKKFLQHPVDLHYFFSEAHGKVQTEITLLSNHSKFIAQGADSKGTASVDQATDKMIAQLRKSKEKADRHH